MDKFKYVKYDSKYKKEVLNLIKECFSVDYLKDVNNNTYIALYDNIVVGNISYQIIEDFYKGAIAYISYVCTKKEYRNRGIAHNLLKLVENEIKKQNIYRIMLTSSYNRDETLKLYLNSGYKIKESNIFIKNI